MGSQVARLSFECSRQEVGRARAFVGATLEGASYDGVRDDAVLMASELVTNAVLHARTALEVAVFATGDVVRIEVSDASPALPRPRSYGAVAATGRGLHLVERVATAWGIENKTVGKTVWLEMAVGAGSRPRRTHASEHEPDLASFADLEAAAGWDADTTTAHSSHKVAA